MKITSSLVAVLSLTLLTGAALAKGIDIPAKEPAVKLDVPDDWKPWETDRGIGAESPDKVITIFFEVVDKKSGDESLKETQEWLKDQKVQLDEKSQTKSDIEVGKIKSNLLKFDAKHDEWGPSVVGLILTPLGDGKRMLLTTYWLTKEGWDKNQPVVQKILDSVTPTGK